MFQISRARAVQEKRLSGDIRDAHGLPGLDDATGHAFAAGIAATQAFRLLEAAGGLYADFPRCRGDEGYAAAQHGQGLADPLEHCFQRVVHIAGSTHDLGNVTQQVQLGRVVSGRDQRGRMRHLENRGLEVDGETSAGSGRMAHLMQPSFRREKTS